jgi:Tol biopolymer transport system component
MLAFLCTILGGCSFGGSEDNSRDRTSARAPPSAPQEEQISLNELRGQGPIVFVRGEGEGSRTSASGQLYVARADGSKLQRLPSQTEWKGALPDGGELTNVATIAARWSPDHRSIAVAKYGWASDPWGWTEIVAANGEQRRVITRPHPGGPYTPPSWSPKGTRLVIHRNQLEVVPVSGGTARGIRLRLAVGDPDWSPDGRQIAVRVNFRPIALTTPTGEPLQYVIRGDDAGPARSPDGAHIAFARETPKRLRGIWVVEADGGNPRRLTSRADESPRWSPDGSKILFRRIEKRGAFKSWELYVMDADGARTTHLPLNLAPEDQNFGLGILSADWG